MTCHYCSDTKNIHQINLANGCIIELCRSHLVEIKSILENSR